MIILCQENKKFQMKWLIWLMKVDKKETIKYMDQIKDQMNKSMKEKKI